MAQHYRISVAYEAICDPSWSWDSREQGFNRFNLWFILKGEGELKTGDRVYRLNPGDCFVLRSRDQQQATHNPQNPLTVPFILFDIVNNHGRPVPVEQLPLLPEHRPIADPAFLYGIMRRVFNAHAHGARGTAEAHRWLDAALAEYVNQPETVARSSDTGHTATMEKWCRQIRQDARFSISVEAMAKQSCLSTDHFIRLFKHYAGTTPADYIIGARIEQAKALLTISSHTIGEIADVTGYPDIHTFSRQFKKRVGKAPSYFRRPL